MLRFASIVLLLGALAHFCGCVGQGFQRLPAAIPPGQYSGELRHSNNSLAGDIGFRLRESGQVSGNGVLLGREVELRGVVNSQGHLNGFVTDSLSQQTGRFEGQFGGGSFSGTWQADVPGLGDTAGNWLVSLTP